MDRFQGSTFPREPAFRAIKPSIGQGMQPVANPGQVPLPRDRYGLLTGTGGSDTPTSQQPGVVCSIITACGAEGEARTAYHVMGHMDAAGDVQATATVLATKGVGRDRTGLALAAVPPTRAAF